MIILCEDACMKVSGGDVILYQFTDGLNHWMDVKVFKMDQFIYDDGHYSFTLSTNGITNLKGPGALNILSADLDRGVIFGNMNIGGECNGESGHFQIRFLR